MGLQTRLPSHFLSLLQGQRGKSSGLVPQGKAATQTGGKGPQPRRRVSEHSQSHSLVLPELEGYQTDQRPFWFDAQKRLSASTILTRAPGTLARARAEPERLSRPGGWLRGSLGVDSGLTQGTISGEHQPLGFWQVGTTQERGGSRSQNSERRFTLQALDSNSLDVTLGRSFHFSVLWFQR